MRLIHLPSNFVIARRPTRAMDYVKLGRTGLDVSRICLGCMSYGGGNRGNHAWSLSEEESKPFIKNPGLVDAGPLQAAWSWPKQTT